MKILLLTDDLMPGGISRYIADITHAFAGTKYETLVASTPGKFLTKLHKNARFLPLNLLKEDSFKKKSFGTIASLLKLCTFIKAEKIDIIHSHKRYTHFLGRILAKHFRIPQITSYHSDLFGKRMFTVFGERVLCCSDAVRAQVVEKYGCPKDKSVTIHYGIHPFVEHSDEQKKTTLNTLGLSGHERIISSVGQFIHVKDRKNLILAIGILKKRMDISDIRLFLLGFGDLKQRMESLIRELQLDETIHILEPLFDVESLFNVSEFMILNSIREGFGIVLLEGASIGKVHIGTNIGGIPEFIENGKTGLLVEKENPEKLADAISYLLGNPVHRMMMEAEARLKFEQQFTIEKMIDKTKRVYDEVYSSLSLK